MASGENPLVAWYRGRIGHPTNRNEVYGYWTFVIGGVLILLGAVWILTRVGTERGTREFGFVLVMLGTVLAIAGGTLRLPLSSAATRLTQVGGVIAVAGVAWFSVLFPEQWTYAGGEIPVAGGVYVGGLVVMGVGAIVAPVVSEGPTQAELADQLSVLAAQHDELTVERVEAVREREELAGEVERLESQLEAARSETAAASEEATAATEAAERASAARDEASERAAAADESATAADERAATAERRAELAEGAAADAEDRSSTAQRRLARIEDSQATFEVYKDRGDEWRWRLVHRNRNVIATSGEGYSSDRTARRGFRSVKRNAPGADVVWLPTETEPEPVADHVNEPDETRASVEILEDDGGKYRWRLRHDNGQVIAIAARGYADASNAREGLASAQQLVGPAEYLTFDPAGFELFEDAAGEYRWRLVAPNGRIVADSGEGYATRSNARRALERVRETAGEAAIDGNSGRRFELFEDAAGEYRWRLVAANGEGVADSGEGYTERNDAREAAERVQRHAPEASAVTIGDAAAEIFEDEGGEYRWRLRHRNGRLLAMAADGFASRSNAVESLNGVKRNLPNAEATE